jgi:hypothetical protein
VATVETIFRISARLFNMESRLSRRRPNHGEANIIAARNNSLLGLPWAPLGSLGLDAVDWACLLLFEEQCFSNSRLLNISRSG